MSVDMWLKQNKKPNLPVKVQLSKNFTDPVTQQPAFWTLTPITSREAEEIQERCWITRTAPNGQTQRELDTMKYMNGLIVKTITDPPLLDKELWGNYGQNNPIDTLGEMLSPAEKNHLMLEINKLYDLNPEASQDKVNDVKNA